MKALPLIFVLLAMVALPASAKKARMTTSDTPPVANQIPYSYTRHGVTISDPYHWLRDKNYPKVSDPQILSYLRAENKWFEAQMKPHKTLVETLFAEMKSRLKEDESTVPQKDGDWLYWERFETGAQYKIWMRKPVGGGPDQIILDENQLAMGHDYFKLGTVAISRDGRLLAWSTDTDGSERYTVRIRDLTTGKELADVIAGVNGDLLFSADGKALLYTPVNAQWRSERVMYHALGTAVAEDRELYREEDSGFQVGISLTQSDRFIIVSTGDNETSELRLLPADDPLAPALLVRARRKGIEYSVDEHDGQLFIHTNEDSPQFSLKTAPVSAPSQWQTLIAPRDDFYMTGVTSFARFFVVEGRERGLDQIEIHDYSGSPAKRIAFDEASYVAELDDNPEYDVSTLRLTYESMVTPDSVIDYDVASGRKETLKVQEVPSGYDPALYQTERIEITARDGTRVPVSIVYRRDFRKDGKGPLYLYAYGAYGYAVPPGFSTIRLSYLDRGFAYAIAHIRGGDDLGQQWQLDGKLTKRTNSFNDFVDVAMGLIKLGYTAAGRIVAAGGSAGGKLMGAVVNSDPDLWGAVAAHVPFVDVLNTMLDESLPLTPGEWPEWGNPITDKAAFDYIRSYSPYDQVKRQAYPPLFVTAGLNDPRVTYWEPAKWVARLRAHKTDANPLLLKTNMSAGHGGKSGRYESLREDAEEAAFFLWQLGMATL